MDAGRQAIAAGRTGEAARIAAAILLERPEDVDALELVALAAARTGDVPGAEAAFRRILAIEPSARWARSDLVDLLSRSGRAGDAEAAAREGVMADPRDPAAHAHLGQLLSERELLPEGAHHLRRAGALGADDPQLDANLARNLLRQGQLEEARHAAKRAARAAPRALGPAVLLAEIAERAGDPDAALAHLARAEPIARAEGRDVLLLRALILARGTAWTGALALLDGLPRLSGAALLLRGRLRDRANRYPEAWADFVAGKTSLAAAAGRHYRRDAIDAAFARIAATPVGLPQAPVRSDVPQPLLVLGFPRSGTTLVEQILAAHPAIRAGGELPFVEDMRGFAAQQLGPYPAGLAALHAADRAHVAPLLRDLYFARLAVHGLAGADVRFVTDKMPLNEVHLPLIRLAFPASPLVRVRRHPLDTVVSVMMHDMTHGSGCGDRPEDAAHHLAAVDRLVRTHVERHGIALHHLRYETLVADFAGSLDRLMAHVGLAPDPAQTLFHRGGRHPATPSYAQVQEPLNARAIGRWRNYEKELAPLLPVLAPIIEASGDTG